MGNNSLVGRGRGRRRIIHYVLSCLVAAIDFVRQATIDLWKRRRRFTFSGGDIGSNLLFPMVCHFLDAGEGTHFASRNNLETSSPSVIIQNICIIHHLGILHSPDMQILQRVIICEVCFVAQMVHATICRIRSVTDCQRVTNRGSRTTRWTRLLQSHRWLEKR